MTDPIKTNPNNVDDDDNEDGPKPTGSLPGIAAISIWLLLEALIGVAGVFTGRFSGHETRLAVLAITTLLALSSLGLLRLQRWGWALALAAAFLSSTYGLYSIVRFHQTQYWVLTLVNFVFFFYLIRPEILSRLR
ncbi:MAG TPA: hypothetical protein VHX63_10050 [Acidobacteriaceae bacterium]|jgi:uncharacterized membrane protein (DUF2068 family)|nr:hypothetical protein [Acidobacteriaceae bacterium]